MATRHPSRQTARRRTRRVPRAQSEPHKPLYRRTLRYEPLEDRRLLALVTVNTPLDVVDIDDGLTSLREAVFATNLVAGPDEIQFDTSLTASGPAMISLSQGELRITDDLTITGPGASLLTIDAAASDPTPDENNGDGSRVFNIDNGEGALFINVTVRGLTLTGGDAPAEGGAIRSREHFTLRDSFVTGNAAVATDSLILSYGGGIAHRDGLLAITGSIIADNFGDFGGGIHLAAGQAFVANTIIAENAGLSGAGIYVDGSVALVSRSTIRDNSAGAFSLGGGIYSSGNLSVFDTTISGNSAAYGGGVFSRTEAVGDDYTLLVNSTISGNTAFERGGGVRNAQGRTVIEHSTITGNLAPPEEGGGVASRGYDSARTEVAHTIIAGNTNSDVDFGTGSINTFVSRGYNLIGDGNAAAVFQEPGDENGVADPLVGPLADNGGFTLPDGSRILTHALLPGSPAINAGDLNAKAGMGAPTYDQRLEPFSRVVNGRIDIGAFEYQSPSDLNFLVDTLADESAGNHGRGDLSLREAIELANLYPSDDTIRFDAALTANGPATILLTMGELRITDDVSIEGLGAELLTIDASGSDLSPGADDGRGSRAFNIDDGSSTTLIRVSITGLTLTGGDVSDTGGGAIRAADAALVIENSTISDNASNVGSGIRLIRGTATIIQSTISNNTDTLSLGVSSSASAVHSSQTDLSVIGSAISGNEGAGVFSPNAGDTQIVDSNFSNNGSGIRINNIGRDTTISGTRVSGHAYGGGIYISTSNGGRTTISNATITNNSNFERFFRRPAGGVTVMAGMGSETTIANSEISGNTGPQGGGVHVEGGTVAITNSLIERNEARVDRGYGGGGGILIAIVTSAEIRECEISNNSSTLRGGGVYAVNGNILLYGCTINGNTAGDGGGVFTNGEVTIDACNVTQNSATTQGGGLSVSSTPGTLAKIVSSTVADNSSGGRGGGVFGSSSSVINSSISGNTAGTGGGGIHASLMTISGSTISDNTADDGGGIWLASSKLLQSTISGNSAVNGAGLYILFTPQVAHSTIAFNVASSFGGGVFVRNGTLTLNHSIVARNSAQGASSDIAGLLGATISPRYSLIGSNSGSGLEPAPVGMPDGNGNLIGGPLNSGGPIDPRFGPLANSGGPTLTHALLSGSPAINAGDSAAMAGVGDVPQYDQRGAPFTRLYGGRIDIGAFESQPNPLQGDYNFNGIVDMADFVIWRKTLNSTTDLRADSNGDGKVNDADWQVWRTNFGRTAESGEQGAGSREQETGHHAPPQRPAWQRTALPGVQSASRPAFRPATQRFTPVDELLMSITQPQAGGDRRVDFTPLQRQSLDEMVDGTDLSTTAIDHVFETLGANLAGTGHPAAG